jgi:valyl-tRNA synthetase
VRVVLHGRGKDLAAAKKEPSGAEAKLANPKYAERAPANVVSGIHARRDTAHAAIGGIQAALNALPERRLDSFLAVWRP